MQRQVVVLDLLEQATKIQSVGATTYEKITRTCIDDDPDVGLNATRVPGTPIAASFSLLYATKSGLI